MRGAARSRLRYSGWERRLAMPAVWTVRCSRLSSTSMAKETTREMRP